VVRLSARPRLLFPLPLGPLPAQPAAGPHDVFSGYNSFGIPEWQEFVQALVDARDPRVDQLYADPPALLALVQTGRELRNRQLSSFGRASKTYSILDRSSRATSRSGERRRKGPSPASASP